MPKIVELACYDAAWRRIERLGLLDVMAEIANIIGGFRLDVLPTRNMNSGMVVREMLDDEFRRAGGWLKEERGGGDIDWIKRLIVNGHTIAVGVELQVSGRGGGSHLTDIIHLRAGLAEADDARIDVAVMVVPTDLLARYLTDRVEGISQVKKYLRQMRADDLPLLLLGIEHDGHGTALPKQPKSKAGAAAPVPIPPAMPIPPNPPIS
jgi:hypothetical protein